MFYEVLTWKQTMDRMIYSVKSHEPRCPVCYDTYSTTQVEQLASHIKRCYTARNLEHYINTSDYNQKTTTERLAMLQEIGNKVNYEISRYLIDHCDLSFESVD